MLLRCILIFLLATNSFIVSQTADLPHVTYIHPKPGSQYPTNQPTLIFKVDKKFISDLNKVRISIDLSGEKSGIVQGDIVLSDNSVIFKPYSPLVQQDKIDVKVFLGIEDWEKPFEYSFHTGSANKLEAVKSDYDYRQEISKPRHSLKKPETYNEVTEINGVSVPSNFPVFKPSLMKEGLSSGKIFITNWIGTPYIMIFENDGTPYFYQRIEERSRDFKLQPNGILTRRYNKDLNAFVGMDSSYSIIDTFKCTNGFATDEHELYMLPDGHYFLIGLEWRNVDMSEIVSGGSDDAIVKENHVQEFDENHNLVFEWLSNEHFNITDAKHINLVNTSGSIDYVHMNSIAVDYDGNIIISSRHLSEVSKIDRETGEFIWRLGGENNQFEFINDDSIGISYQHHARPVKGKPDHYTIFDNGNFHSPKFSRAVEFKIDTTDMTAEKVWEYRDSPDKYSWWMGNAQRLPNGNTLINWADGTLPKATEVTPEGEKVYEGDFVSFTHTYRTFKFDWENVSPKPYLLSESYPDRVILIFNKFGDKNVKEYIVYRGRGESDLAPIDTVAGTYKNVYDFPQNGEFYFRVSAVDSSGNESQLSNLIKVPVNFAEPGSNYIYNGDFTEGTDNWSLGIYEDARAEGVVTEGGEYNIKIDSSGNEIWSIQLVQGNIPLIETKEYIFEFDARAESDKVIEAKLERAGDPYENYSQTGQTVLGRTMKHYKYEFTMAEATDYYARVVFNSGKSKFGNSEADVYIDNVSVKEAGATDVEESEAIPDTYKLSNNYPNPFNPETTIKYSLPERSLVKIEVYNLLGERIKELIHHEQNAGIHEITFNSQGLSSGIYFYTMHVNSSSNKTVMLSKKMILLK